MVADVADVQAGMGAGVNRGLKRYTSMVCFRAGESVGRSNFKSKTPVIISPLLLRHTL